MNTEPSDQSQPDSTLRTADELFARLECTHIITVNNPSQNVHLERIAEGFRLIFGSEGERHYSREFASLDEVYDVMGGEIRSPRFSLQDAIWQDISEYPAFPSPYRVLYLPLGGPVELHVLPDNEQVTSHGPHVVYGPVAISSPQSRTYLVTPAASWMVIEHPAFTYRGQGGRVILRPTRNLWERWRLKYDNFRLRHDRRVWTNVRPGVTVIYGKPPADWQSSRQLIAAEGPASAP
jgi:hypothetical protein